MKILATVILTLSFLAAGNADYDDEKAQESLYCEMTDAGHWGAYDESIECGE